MNLKYLIGGLVASLGLGVSVGLAVHGATKDNERAQVVEATDGGYYYTGSLTSWTEPGSNQNYKMQAGDSYDLGKVLNLHMTSGQTIAFGKPGWTDMIRWSNLNSGGGYAKKFFSDANDGDHNIKCLVTGNYNFFINSSKQVYVDFSTSTTVYIQLKEWTNTYVYCFDETTSSGNKLEVLGGWPGTNVASHSWNANFNNGLGGIGKININYHTQANTKIIIHNNSGTQTSNLALVLNGYYKNDGTAGNANLGSAADVVINVANAIKDATNSSVCNISKEDAATLYNSYSSLNSTSKAAVDASTLWTYKTADIGGDYADISYSLIMPRLQTIMNKPASSKVVISMEDTAAAAPVMIATTGVITLTTVGGYFFIKKKPF